MPVMSVVFELVDRYGNRVSRKQNVSFRPLVKIRYCGVSVSERFWARLQTARLRISNIVSGGYPVVPTVSHLHSQEVLLVQSRLYVHKVRGHSIIHSGDFLSPFISEFIHF